MPKIIPIKDLKNTAEISEICHATNEPIFVTKNGYGDMVVMSIAAYEEKMALLDFKEKIFAAQKEAKEGKLLDAREELNKLKESLREQSNV